MHWKLQHYLKRFVDSLIHMPHHFNLTFVKKMELVQLERKNLQLQKQQLEDGQKLEDSLHEKRLTIIKDQFQSFERNHTTTPIGNRSPIQQQHHQQLPSQQEKEYRNLYDRNRNPSPQRFQHSKYDTRRYDDNNNYRGRGGGGGKRNNNPHHNTRRDDRDYNDQVGSRSFHSSQYKEVLNKGIFIRSFILNVMNLTSIENAGRKRPHEDDSRHDSSVKHRRVIHDEEETFKISVENETIQSTTQQHYNIDASSVNIKDYDEGVLGIRYGSEEDDKKNMTQNENANESEEDSFDYAAYAQEMRI